MRFDAAAVQFDQPASNSETDTQTALRSIERLIGLSEDVPNPRQQFFTDSDSGIAHVNVSMRVVRYHRLNSIRDR